MWNFNKPQDWPNNPKLICSDYHDFCVLYEYLGYNSHQPYDGQGEETMENGKKFAILSKCDVAWHDQPEAEAAAKRATQKYGKDYYVIQAIAQTKVPTPEIELTKL